MAKGVEGLGAKLAKKGTKAVIHIDQLSEQTASVAIKRSDLSKAVMFKDQQSRQLQITLRHTWLCGHPADQEKREDCWMH